MVQFGFEEGLGAGDVDSILADELRARDIACAEGFCDERYRARIARVGGLDRDLLHFRLVKERDRSRTAEVDVCLAADVYLSVVIDRNMVPVKPAFLLDGVKFQPVRVPVRVDSWLDLRVLVTNEHKWNTNRTYRSFAPDRNGNSKNFLYPSCLFVASMMARGFIRCLRVS